MRLALVALVLVACSKTPSGAPGDSGAPAPVLSAEAPATSALAPIDAGPKPQTFQASYAHFEKGRLFECVDLSLRIPGGIDAGANPFAKAEKGMKGTSKISDSCAVQFADRLVLATCTHEEVADGGAAVYTATASFYDFEDVGMNDEQMADCMKEKGKWHAVSRDSMEWKKAKLEYDRRKLRKTIDKLEDNQ